MVYLLHLGVNNYVFNAFMHTACEKVAIDLGLGCGSSWVFRFLLKLQLASDNLVAEKVMKNIKLNFQIYGNSSVCYYAF